jgi:peptide deformylase
MATRNILPESDPTLSKKSREITAFNKRLHILLDDMRHTLIEANGLGLAAPQVGVLRRAALIVDLTIDSEDVEDQIIELINPVLLDSTGEQKGTEGCLSFPGLYGIVKRPNYVEIQAQDRHGNEFTYNGDELVARAICHELDHLNGILFTNIAEKVLTEEELEELRAEIEANRMEHETEKDIETEIESQLIDEEN